MNKSEAKKAFEKAAVVPLYTAAELFGEEAAVDAASITGNCSYFGIDDEGAYFLNYRGFMAAAKFAREKEKRQ